MVHVADSNSRIIIKLSVWSFRVVIREQGGREVVMRPESIMKKLPTIGAGLDRITGLK
jgi:hypothetical protein